MPAAGLDPSGVPAILPGSVRRWETLLGPAIALVLGLFVILAARWGPDWPAQEFRAWIASYDGLHVWTNRWYGGQALPSYSVLYPVVAGAAGAGLCGLVASIVAAWAAATLAPEGPWRSRLFHVSVGLGLTENLLIGQVPFLLGLAFGLLAIKALMSGRPVVVITLLAILSGLSSPLAGALLLVTIPAFGMAFDWRRPLGLTGAAIGPAVSSIFGGSGGPFPFQWQALGATSLLCALLGWTARGKRPVQCFAVCYWVVAVAMFAAPNPIGGNITRIGKLIALPLACHFLAVTRARRVAPTVAVAVLAFLWPAVPFASSIAHGAGDPSQHRAYYTGLLRFLKTQDASTGRIEIPFTREHWETLWVAQSFPLARGWERQTDLQYNAVLYGPLSQSAYRRWLDDNSVSLVAVPNVALDYGGQSEEAVIDEKPSYLQPVWHDRNWSVWRVAGAYPVVTGAATLVHLAPSSISMHFSKPGMATVHIRDSKLWQVQGASGCVDATPESWLAVHARHQGTVTIDASLSRKLFTPYTKCAR